MDSDVLEIDLNIANLSLVDGSSANKNPPLVEPTEIKIVSKYGLLIKSLLTVTMKDDNIIVFWRNSPETLGCELTFLKSVSEDPVNSKRLQMRFHEFDLVIEFESEDICNEIGDLLSALMQEMASTERDTSSGGKHLQALRTAAYQINIKQEMLLQLCSSLKAKEGAMIVEKVLLKTSAGLLKSGFDTWTHFIRETNSQRMNDDKWRWRLHAASNQDMDLQAWYHAIFYQEVYR